jgi:hypothetical protein
LGVGGFALSQVACQHSKVVLNARLGRCHCSTYGWNLVAHIETLGSNHQIYTASITVPILTMQSDGIIDGTIMGPLYAFVRVVYCLLYVI